MDTLSTFANRFKKLREERGLSQSDLAKELNISRGSVSFYENGSRSPDIKVLADICNYFHVTSDYMIGLSDNKTIESSNIGVEIGLTDEAINVLKSKKSNKFYTIVLSYLIVQEDCLKYLLNYLATFAIKEFWSSKYSIFPLKRGVHSHYTDVCFSGLIRRLPKYYDEMKRYFLNDNKEGLKYLILEFAAQNVDISAVKEAADIVEEYPAYFECSCNEDDYEEYVTTYEDEQKLMEQSILYQEEKFDIAVELLSYIDQRRGEPNGDSTKEG